jgi:hypothetical protein
MRFSSRSSVCFISLSLSAVIQPSTLAFFLWRSGLWERRANLAAVSVCERVSAVHCLENHVGCMCIVCPLDLRKGESRSRARAREESCYSLVESTSEKIPEHTQGLHTKPTTESLRCCVHKQILCTRLQTSTNIFTKQTSHNSAITFLRESRGKGNRPPNPHDLRCKQRISFRKPRNCPIVLVAARLGGRTRGFALSRES